MNKLELNQQVISWLHNYVENKLLNSHVIVEIFCPSRALSHENNPNLKKIHEFNTWEFKPDIVGILRSKVGNTFDVIFINTCSNSTSLRQIGEQRVYSLVAKPLLSMVISEKGSSNDVSLLMLEEEIRERSLTYDTDKTIYVVGWDEESSRPHPDKIIPLERKKDLI